MVEEIKSRGSPKKVGIFREINYFPGQSVFLKINKNQPVHCFLLDFRFFCFWVSERTIFSECRGEAVLGTF